VYGAQSYDSKKRGILPFLHFMGIVHLRTKPARQARIHQLIFITTSPHFIIHPTSPNTIHRTARSIFKVTSLIIIQPTALFTLFTSLVTIHPLTLYFSPRLALRPNSPLQFIKFITLPFYHSPHFNLCHSPHFHNSSPFALYTIHITSPFIFFPHSPHVTPFTIHPTSSFTLHPTLVFIIYQREATGYKESINWNQCLEYLKV
jgi:hypothetical protein